MKGPPVKETCPFCKKLYSKKYLKVHLSSVHGEKSSPCQEEPISADLDDLVMDGVLYAKMMAADCSSPIPTEAAIPEKPGGKRLQPEEKIQRKLEKKLGGKHQTTDVGIIDILTETELIEIKAWSNWKSALGQVFAYGHYYPTHMKRIHLFGPPPAEKLQQAIFAVCASLRIRVTIEPFSPEK